MCVFNLLSITCEFIINMSRAEKKTNVQSGEDRVLVTIRDMAYTRKLRLHCIQSQVTALGD